MSRHKLVRDLDLDAELDDYDADDYEEDASGMTDSDRSQLREGVKQAREILGHDIPGLTDKEIEDSLWYYYFDVPKTVNYILNQHGKTQAKKSKAKPKGSAIGQGLGFGTFYSSISLVDLGFFADMPWGNVPEDRKGELTVQTTYPLGGLLGGSGKSSKLAELARKRKEKAAQASVSSNSGENITSVSLLSRLSQKQVPQLKDAVEPASRVLPAPKVESSEGDLPLSQPEPTSVVQKPESIADLDQSKSETPPVPDTPIQAEVEQPEKPPMLVSQPSEFAQSILGERLSFHQKNPVADKTLFYLPGKAETAKNNAFGGPSPDDIVIAAQSGSKGLNKDVKPATKPAKKQTEDLDIAALNLDPTPAKKMEKIDVLKAYSESNAKDTINFVVVGHVDAGKSTLMGRMLYDCGAVDERLMRKFRQESEQIGKGSFALAWVLDQTEEERSRGVTIDIATNQFETEKAQFTILDAPGHKDFVPNMIAGASQADFAVLVIDASTGAFESGFHRQGQTKEHTLLVRSIGVQRIVVAVNKLDAVGWAESRFEEIVQQMTQFLTNAGFNMKNVTFVPLSGLVGTNVVKKPEKGLIPWYKGPTLLEELESTTNLSRAVEKPLRLVISDVFRGGIQNPVSISGRIDSGYLQEGEMLVTIPSKEQASVKSIIVNEEPSKWAVAGHNVVIHLSGIDPIHLRPGDVLCSLSSPLIPLSRFTVKLLAFEGLTPMAVDVHKGRLHAAGRISKMVETIDKSTGEASKKPPRHIQSGALARVVVELLEESIPVEAGNRIVLRNNGATVAAGIIE